MKTIAEIIEAWKANKEPLIEGVDKCFEKDCSFGEVPEIYEGVEIKAVVRDRFTHVDGIYQGASVVSVFIARYQGHSDETLKAVEARQFELFLREFTKDFVESRRKELLELKSFGHKIVFVGFNQ